MPRLTQDEWARARAEYEVKGVSIREIARTYGLNPANVSRKARADGWKQGESQHVVAEKVAAVAELARVEGEKATLPSQHQAVIDEATRDELQARGLGISFQAAILRRGIEMARIVDRPCDLKTLAETHATLHPQPKAGLTLNLSQQQGQNQKTAVSAQDALECFAGQDRMAIVESESHD